MYFCSFNKQQKYNIFISNPKNMAFYDLYRVAPDKKLSLKKRNPADTLDFEKENALAKLAENIEAIDELQTRLYAEDKRSVLLVIQAMDAAGKDSTIKAITNGLNPQGVLVQSFKAPTEEEKSHDFLWRIHQKTPQKGHITIFNRSHYEDVLIVRVHGWASEKLIKKRYGQINDFERLLHEHGTKVVKIMLHISPAYQLAQFKERLEDPKKHWKFNPADLEERKLWDKYMRSYELALSRCSTEQAPWYVVPAEHKWFRTLVVSQILRDALEKMKPRYPEPTFDPTQFKADQLV